LKWSIIFISALGVLSAISAAFMILSFQTETTPNNPPDEAIDTHRLVLTAKFNLPAMRVIKSTDVELLSIPASTFSDDMMIDPTQAIGRLLINPLLGGQAITESTFAADEGSSSLAYRLEHGTRAVRINLSDGMGMEGLLLPGSIVDVLASLDLEGGQFESIDNAITTTILERVLVLGVGSSTVAGEMATTPEQPRLARNGVTLLLTPGQAEQLKLAMEHGHVSLALRNPLDLLPIERQERDGARLSDLSTALLAIADAQYAEELQRKLLDEQESAQELERAKYEREQDMQSSIRARAEFELARLKIEQELHQAIAQDHDQSSMEWEVMVIRGTEMKIHVFPNASNDKSEK
jgi:Flp pilus assembly protein CpaB